MRVFGTVFCIFTFLTGGCLFPSRFYFGGEAFADTLILKNGKELKGLVVEKHQDRILFSTEKGELPILLKGIREIHYDDPEQSLMEVGKGYETRGKPEIALAYYEKVLEVKPGFQEAKLAAMGVRNRLWAVMTEGPRNEIEKQQMLYDTWGQGSSLEEWARQREKEDYKALSENLGISLSKKEDWARLENVDSKRPGWNAGLRKNDRLVSIDGESLRYLNIPVVTKKLLVPRFSNFTLEFEREVFLHKEAHEKLDLRALGLKIQFEYQGLGIVSVKEKSLGAQSGLKSGDLLTQVNGVPTRYMALNEVKKLIENSKEDRIVFTVRRPALLTRR